MTVLHRGAHEFQIPGTEGINLVGSWLYDPRTLEQVIGLHLHHPYDEIRAGHWAGCCGGGYIAWTETPSTPAARHQLIRGGPDQLDELTINPSLWHRGRPPYAVNGNSPHHGCHGYITDGTWVVVD